MAGAGAWQRPKWYDKNTVGTNITVGVDDADRHRIRWAARGIEAELQYQGYLDPSVTPDGVFHDKTDAAIKHFQQAHGLEADGAVGPLTAQALFRPVIIFEENMGRVQIPGHYLHGQIKQESYYDPGAEGTATDNGIDRGIGQLNSEANPGVTAAMAYSNPRLGIAMMAARLRESRRHETDEKSYADQGRWDCAILDWNSPHNADILFDTGKYPTQQAYDYVTHIMDRGRKF